MDLGGTSVKVATAAGYRLSGTVEFPVTGTTANLGRVLDAARRLAPSGTLGAVAAAVPGIVDTTGGVLEAHGKYGWLVGQDFAQWGADRLGATVVVENYARAALIGDAATGVAAGETDAVILALGIGTAAIVNGVPLRGLDGSAGILCGHVTVDWNGSAYNCENIGCTEVYGGSWALGDRLRDAARSRRVTVDPAQGFADLTAAARALDALATEVLDQAFRAWSVGTVTMCHAYNPRVVVLAGGVALAAGIVVPRPGSSIDDHFWSSLSRASIRLAREPEFSALAGSRRARQAPRRMTPGIHDRWLARANGTPRNHDISPSVPVSDGERVLDASGFRAHVRALEVSRGGDRPVVALDTYPSVDLVGLETTVRWALPGWVLVDAERAALPIDRIDVMIAPNLTDDRVFGRMSQFEIDQLYDEPWLQQVRAEVDDRPAPTVVHGSGATLATPDAGVVMFVDLAQREAKRRFRAGAPNWRSDDGAGDSLRKFNRGYFVEWRVAEAHKIGFFDHIDATAVIGGAFREALARTAHRPFRVVRYFDPEAWGRYRMETVLGLEPAEEKLAWGFDSVPEENSILLSDHGPTSTISLSDTPTTHARWHAIRP